MVMMMTKNGAEDKYAVKESWQMGQSVSDNYYSHHKTPRIPMTQEQKGELGVEEKEEDTMALMKRLEVINEGQSKGQTRTICWPSSRLICRRGG